MFSLFCAILAVVCLLPKSTAANFDNLVKGEEALVGCPQVTAIPNKSHRAYFFLGIISLTSQEKELEYKCYLEDFARTSLNNMFTDGDYTKKFVFDATKDYPDVEDFLLDASAKITESMAATSRNYAQIGCSFDFRKGNNRAACVASTEEL
ncbi:hypothetical protein Y032_0269g808 [Ancylostoma ceylanicum]|uniref:Ground-like domain-containing protein n=1 Tax=Ancylostoma ceylanicum TaxID=53326 RepID=A0A016S8Q2_9BILA|nr:hypothetical protein Y032_0269g808 [Ancylostoma ceylanicum]